MVDPAGKPPAHMRPANYIQRLRRNIRSPRLLYLLALLCPTLLLTLPSACSDKTTAPAGLAKLETAFRRANQAADIGPMLALYHLEGASANTVQLLKNALRNELGLPIARIEFAALNGAPEESIHFVHDGVAYGPSLTPAHRMRVSYAVEDGFTSLFSIGQTDAGSWRIVCAKPIAGP